MEVNRGTGSDESLPAANLIPSSISYICQDWHQPMAQGCGVRCVLMADWCWAEKTDSQLKAVVSTLRLTSEISPSQISRLILFTDTVFYLVSHTHSVTHKVTYTHTHTHTHTLQHLI